MSDLNIKTMSYKITDAVHYDKFRLRENLATSTPSTAAAAAAVASTISTIQNKPISKPTFMTHNLKPQHHHLQPQQQKPYEHFNKMSIPTGGSYMLATRCGEIFVAKNARRWTFMCTFCNKSTRDIGVFICHIKNRHLNQTNDINADEDTSDDDDDVDNQMNDSLDFGNGVHNQHAPKLNTATATANHMNLWKHSNNADNDNTNTNTADDSSFDNSSSLHTSTRQLNNRARNALYCSYCNRTFQYYSLYRNHMDKHTNNYPNRCNYCNRGFKSKQALRYHLTTHERDKRFQCKLCANTFALENHFLTHMQSHATSTCFPCQLCGQVYESNFEREEHMNEHSEDRPYKCEHCGKLFRKRHHLSNHLKLHRQYRCDYCRLEFNSATQLSKPYACPSCEQKASQGLLNEPAGSGAATNIGENNDLSLYHFMSTQAHFNPNANPNTNQNPNQKNENNFNANNEGNVIELLSGKERQNNDNQNAKLEQQQQQQQQQQQDQQQHNYKNRFNCDYCELSYATVSALNYHVRNKHY